jgi:hypothetical protein
MDVGELRKIQDEVHGLTIRVGTMESLYANKDDE